MQKNVSLKDFVQYQNKAIVSREILKNENGTVTIFAFDKNQGLSEHKASFNALVYIIDGKANITISNKKYNLKKGEMIVMPANKIHSLKAPERFKMLLTMIKP